jgi:hypothetical protein
MTIHRLLALREVKFETEYVFPDLFGDGGRQLRFDFAVLNNDNSLKCLIEYQGDIHYAGNNRGWNTEEAYEKRKIYDERKLKYCQDNQIMLYYITYQENIEERLEEIFNELYC